MLVPGDHGIFDITVNGDLVFSKLKEKRFPEIGELSRAIQNYLE